MTPTEADGGSDGFEADVRSLTDQQRAADAADARRREHSLRAQAAEDGTFAGVLVDLAERGQQLAVSTLAGRVVRGVVHAVGADFVALRSPGGEEGLVPLDAVTAVRAEPGSTPTVGDRAVQVLATLAGSLAELAVDRPWISLHTRQGEAVVGQLRRAGRDVLSVRTDGGATTYLPLANLNDVVVP
ncbi:hypothetical protein BH10ACT1_BH10ACT1_00510 [soil metagenome]